MADRESPAYLPPGAQCDMPRPDQRPEPGCEPLGFLLIDKPKGLTSHDVVARVRRRLGMKKVGHSGTLDPMATGLLIVAVGRATRLLNHVTSISKSYTATVRIGLGTDTDDAEGAVVSRPGLGEQMLQAPADAVDSALAQFVGTIEQVPSRVSAKKINGKRAYELVREGKEVDLKPVTVTISSCSRIGPVYVDADEEGTTYCDVSISVTCSSGTYVRAIARDLGLALGSAAHLTALRRTRIHSFSVHQAATLQDLAEHGAALVHAPLLVMRRLMPTYDLGERDALAICHGQQVALPASRPTVALCALAYHRGTSSHWAGECEGCLDCHNNDGAARPSPDSPLGAQTSQIMLGVGRIGATHIQPATVIATPQDIIT